MDAAQPSVPAGHALSAGRHSRAAPAPPAAPSSIPRRPRSEMRRAVSAQAVDARVAEVRDGAACHTAPG